MATLNPAKSNVFFSTADQQYHYQYYKSSEYLNNDAIDNAIHYVTRTGYEYLSSAGGLSKRAFYNARTVISAVFSYAYTMDIPCIDITMVSTKGLLFQEKQVHSEEVYLPEQRSALLHHLESLKTKTAYSLAIQLMFCLCCRIGELRALKYEDIEWNSNHTGASI